MNNMNDLTKPRVELSEQQELAAQAAADYIERFENGETDKPFVLSGFAGTGKTFTVKEIVSRLSRNPAYMAYTGKAALVLRKYAKVPARTIHSTIYMPKPPDQEELKKLYAEYEKLTQGTTEHVELGKKIAEASEMQFLLKDCETAFPDDQNLLVLDECSMVNDEVLKDLKGFGLPIFALGDPGQLPPIDGTGALFRGMPDATLTEIRRQALDNPIIDWSMRARKMIALPSTDPATILTDRAAKIYRAMIPTVSQFEELMSSHDVIICWRNKTRLSINSWYRRMKGYNQLDGTYPTPGERLIITKNDRDKGLFNGQFADVVEIKEYYGNYIKMVIVPEDETPRKVEIDVPMACFDVYHDEDAMKRLRPWELVGKQQVDFGYCLTCHKAQGSQWDRVMVLDENVFNWPAKYTERAQWLYTAVTRAVEKLTIVVEGRK